MSCLRNLCLTICRRLSMCMLPNEIFMFTGFMGNVTCRWPWEIWTSCFTPTIMLTTCRKGSLGIYSMSISPRLVLRIHRAFVFIILVFTWSSWIAGCVLDFLNLGIIAAQRASVELFLIPKNSKPLKMEWLCLWGRLFEALSNRCGLIILIYLLQASYWMYSRAFSWLLSCAVMNFVFEFLTFEHVAFNLPK